MIEKLFANDNLQNLISSAEELKNKTVSGVSGSFTAFFASLISRHFNKSVLIITRDELRARELHEDISLFMQEKALYFPAREPVFFDIESAGKEFMYKRLDIMNKLLSESDVVISTSVEALALKLPLKESFQKKIVKINTGLSLDIDKLSETLVDYGYSRVDRVEAKGEFSRRGSIIDIFSVDSDLPIRVDLFGDEVDSLKCFDTMSQRSLENMDSCNIIPALEYAMTKTEREILLYNTLDTNEIKSLDREKLDNGMYFPSLDRYLSHIYTGGHTLFDYLLPNAIIVFEGKTNIEAAYKEIIKQHFEMLSHISPIFNIDEFYYHIGKRIQTEFSPLDAIGSGKAISSQNFSFNIKRTGDFMTNPENFFKKLKELKNNKYKIIILTTGLAHGSKISSELANVSIDAAYTEQIDSPMQNGEIKIVKGRLNESIEIDEFKIAIFSENIFLQHNKKKKKFSKDRTAKIDVFTELKKGELIVHYSHGIGRYDGIESLQIENIKKDYLKISYKDSDVIYIPVNQVDLIAKYIGSDSKVPKLSKLGGSEWVKAKKRVKDSLKDIAAELLALYSKRESLKGFSFSKDTIWQKEFEEEFPHEETDDQLRSVEDIKKDMESEKPMDRLLCGDVGYGKTEVALRAVFKAAIDSKQVAFLVPTTILAQQHYHTFKERLKNYPVSVDVISRFRTDTAQNKILEDVKKGKLDILIGTHRLLSKDIKFKNLGLLVVDEEQRFGVEHKEKIKTLYPNADVLTLSATPIPRTLHMSLSGIRDISIIEQPPEERYPVQTYVFEYDEEVIRSAIRRELARNGQVFYLSNRVENIESKAASIKKIVGEKTRVAIAHGQMHERNLEKTIEEFLEGKYDVLVCTTIIESGLDMHNVNTIIIEDADRMGLAQLYQLRGRVGRAGRQAYAYITTKKGKSITETAEKRLEAIREFTDFGSGFKVAMRDMEIRGAGNLLGAQQHGQLESVGYDMYCKLLHEAILELQGGFIERTTLETSIDVKLNAFIPDSYINIEYQKIEAYKKIANILDDADFHEVYDELIDRYGEIPQSTYNLMEIAQIKSLASHVGIINISERPNGYLLEFSKEIGVTAQVVMMLYEKHGKNTQINNGVKPSILVKPQKTVAESLEYIKFMLREMKSFEQQ